MPNSELNKMEINKNMIIVIDPSKSLIDKLGDFLGILNCTVENYGNTLVRHKWQFNKENLYNSNCDFAYNKAKRNAKDELENKARSKFNNESKIALITKEIEKNFDIGRGDDIFWSKYDDYREKSFEICCQLTLQAEAYRIN